MSVAVIAAVGQAANRLILHHPKKLYQERINELNMYVTQLDGHIANMRQYRSELRNFWEGETAEHYDVLMGMELESLESSRMIVANDIALYQGLIADLEDTQNVTSALMGDVESALSSLNSALSNAAGGGDGSFGGGAGGGGTR